MLVAPGNPVLLRFQEPSFADLRDRGRRAVEAGRLTEALECFDGALDVARRRGEPSLVDLATCNRAAVLITLGRHAEVMADLRQILVANREEEGCFLAAYNLSRAHVRDRGIKKALFYARIARDRAEEIRRDEWRVWAFNQVANCLADESYFEEASGDYLRAWSLLSEKKSVLGAMVTMNLGYCHVMTGQLEKGFEHLFRSLRWFRALGARVYEVVPHQDLAYAYLEIDRPERARRHAARALHLAEGSGDPARIKGSLFLLGEAQRACEDWEGARAAFERLQQDHYPDAPDMTELFLNVSMRKVVNLRT